MPKRGEVDWRDYVDEFEHGEFLDDEPPLEENPPGDNGDGEEDDDLEYEVSCNVLGILESLARGDLDKAAAERDVDPEQLAAATITEMARQAFSGEWEEG